jgi:hypothetical protein
MSTIAKDLFQEGKALGGFFTDAMGPEFVGWNSISFDLPLFFYTGW